MNGVGMCLDGKKVIFIGDSFIYYGQTVLDKTNKKLELCDRVRDKGLFYQLCMANGKEVSVTNWTFGGHSLASIMIEEKCTCQKQVCFEESHKARLTDHNYDLVIISPGRGSKRFFEELTAIKSVFTAENPDTRFALLCSSGVYGLTDSKKVNYNILNNLKTAKRMGYTVVDWGGLVNGLICGAETVEGIRHRYDKNTFVIRKSATDGHHPNQLAGYITTLMTYSAVTGEKAEGQPLLFGSDLLPNPVFDTKAFVSRYYKDGATTNYSEIMSDEQEMLSLQRYIDSYLAKGSFLDYNFTETEQ